MAAELATDTLSGLYTAEGGLEQAWLWWCWQCGYRTDSVMEQHRARQSHGDVLCACGCQEVVLQVHARPTRFIKGHHNKLPRFRAQAAQRTQAYYAHRKGLRSKSLNYASGKHR